MIMKSEEIPPREVSPIRPVIVLSLERPYQSYLLLLSYIATWEYSRLPYPGSFWSER